MHKKKIFICCLFFVLLALTGCVKNADLNKARKYEKESLEDYRKSILSYKELISRGRELDGIYLELGRLYYGHGDFANASESLRKSEKPEAKRLLAITEFRSGNFTDALEAFNRFEGEDAEYLYYRGLNCEKLNLFDEALKAYKRIKDNKFSLEAAKRIEAIERNASGLKIEDIDPDAYRIISSSPGAKEYPQAGALILSCDEKIEITAQGTQVSYAHYLIKILNERGKEQFSETQVEYDSTYEKVELLYARTIKPDGTVADVGSRHIRDVSKYLNFPLYSNARVYIISFPEIAEGSVIEYKLKVKKSRLINKKDFVLAYPLQSSEPLIAARFDVSVPKESRLNIKIINERYNDFKARLAPEIKEKDGRLFYSWHFKEIPQIIPEARMPPNAEINPVILASSFKDWQEVYDWWWQLAKDKIQADEEIRKKTAELLKDKALQEDKIRALYNFCSQEIRYVAVEYGQAGYEPHAAGDIFRNKYGDCKDKAILLITMLKEAGITAWPVLIATKDYYNMGEDFPSMMFNHAIAAAQLGKEIIFLDATAMTCSLGDLPPDDQGRRVLSFEPGGYKIRETPLFSAGHNMVKQEIRIKVNKEEGVSAKKENITFGAYDQAQRYWLIFTQPELIGESLKEKIQDVSVGARLGEYLIENLEDLSKPCVLSYAFSGPEYFTVAGALRILPQLAVVDTSLAAKDSRRYPLDFGIPEVKESSWELEMPAGFSIKYLPETVARENDWISFKAEYSNRRNKLYFKQRVEIKKPSVPAEAYPQFKGFIEDLAKHSKQRLVLEKER